jgi:hypothetical protein
VDIAAGALALGTIVACSALIVVLAADRPSFLSATTIGHFFPGWMAGPLGGLWPSLTRSPEALKFIVTGAIVAMYAGYLASLRYAPRLPLRWVLAAIGAAHLIVLMCPPFSLTDVFNYVNYGRMEVIHQLNPYTTIPVLEPHSDPSFALSNWHQLLSPYGPLFTLITFAVVPLGVAGSFWALKTLLMAASLATVWLVWKCARLLGRDPVQAIILVGLNPIVLVWGLGGDHNDSLMIVLVALGFYLLLRGRALAPERHGTPEPGGGGSPALTATGADAHGDAGQERRQRGGAVGGLHAGAGAAFVTAVAIKASAGILLPVVLAGALRDRRRLAGLLLGMALAGLVLGVCSLIAFGLHLPDLGTQGRLVTNTSLPNLLGLALGQGGETNMLRRILGGVLIASVAACCALAFRRRESLSAAGWASVALIVTLSWVLPWYVLWVLPLAALAGSRRLRATALLLGVYLIAAWAPVTGIVFDAIGFHPEKTSLGRLHQRYVKELLF